MGEHGPKINKLYVRHSWVRQTGGKREESVKLDRMYREEFQIKTEYNTNKQAISSMHKQKII